MVWQPRIFKNAPKHWEAAAFRNIKGKTFHAGAFGNLIGTGRKPIFTVKRERAKISPVGKRVGKFVGKKITGILFPKKSKRPRPARFEKPSKPAPLRVKKEEPFVPEKELPKQRELTEKERKELDFPKAEPLPPLKESDFGKKAPERKGSIYD